jgi:glycosyltransferase involved in cell wall biosynthesis
MHYYDFGLCRGLLAAGCHVSLYTSDETIDPLIPGLGFYPYFRRIFGLGNRWLQAKNYFYAALGTMKKAAASGETICHFQVFNTPLLESVVVTLARLFGMKVVLTVHDVNCLVGQKRGNRRITGWIYRHADRLIVHNQISMKELEGIGVPSAKISIIPHGHYLDSIRELPLQSEARGSLGIAESAKVVLFFGQIHEAKGLELLIDAIPAVARRVPEVKFLIVGRPLRSDFSKYDALIDELDVRERCCLRIGYVPDSEVARYFAAADVVALPYRRIYQSGALIMAMCYGRATVVSDLPGMTEMITDGVNGFVFSNGSKDELAHALIRALQNDEARRRVSASASEYIREHNDWGRIGERTADLYETLLNR